MTRRAIRDSLAWIVPGFLSLLALQTVATGSEAPVPSRPVLSATASPATTARTAIVLIKDFKFSPQTLTVAVGTTIIWENRDDEPHTVRGDSEIVRSGALDQGEMYSVRFDRPGIYKYGCSIHPRMSGTIVVR